MKSKKVLNEQKKKEPKNNNKISENKFKFN